MKKERRADERMQVYQMQMKDERLKTKNVINSIIRFLRDNEEYGDDWETEIKVLKSLREKEG
jgi:hypothetical protein|tara:strand:+ start:2484 stop:2669 length:186 start_codon:yes stop_codon:yes gene_type:complete